MYMCAHVSACVCAHVCMLNEIACNFNMQLYDYYYKLRYKTFNFNACYHTLTAYLSFYVNLSYNLKMYYFKDNYVFLKIYFKVDYSHPYLKL